MVFLAQTQRFLPDLGISKTVLLSSMTALASSNGLKYLGTDDGCLHTMVGMMVLYSELTGLHLKVN